MNYKNTLTRFFQWAFDLAILVMSLLLVLVNKTDQSPMVLLWGFVGLGGLYTLMKIVLKILGI